MKNTKKLTKKEYEEKMQALVNEEFGDDVKVEFDYDTKK